MHVEVIKCIAYGPVNQEENIFLHRVFDLPFAPFEGLKLVQGEWAEEVESVEWDVEEQFFTCWTEYDETYLGQFVDEETLRALVSTYNDQRLGRNRGAARPGPVSSRVRSLARLCWISTNLENCGLRRKPIHDGEMRLSGWM